MTIGFTRPKPGRGQIDGYQAEVLPRLGSQQAGCRSPGAQARTKSKVEARYEQAGYRSGRFLRMLVRGLQCPTKASSSSVRRRGVMPANAGSLPKSSAGAIKTGANARENVVKMAADFSLQVHRRFQPIHGSKLGRIGLGRVLGSRGDLVLAASTLVLFLLTKDAAVAGDMGERLIELAGAGGRVALELAAGGPLVDVATFLAVTAALLLYRRWLASRGVRLPESVALPGLQPRAPRSIRPLLQKAGHGV